MHFMPFLCPFDVLAVINFLIGLSAVVNLTILRSEHQSMMFLTSSLAAVLKRCRSRDVSLYSFGHTFHADFNFRILLKCFFLKPLFILLAVWYC